MVVEKNRAKRSGRNRGNHLNSPITTREITDSFRFD